MEQSNLDGGERHSYVTVPWRQERRLLQYFNRDKLRVQHQRHELQISVKRYIPPVLEQVRMA